MNRALRVAAVGIGGLMIAGSAAASDAPTIGHATGIVVQAPTRVSITSTAPFGEWYLAILVALVPVLAGVTVAVRRGRMKRPIGWSGAALLVAAGAVLVFLPVHSASSDSGQMTQTEQSFLAAINSVRTAHGVQPLSSQGNLVRAARSHSDDMIQHDYFAHRVFWKRLLRFGVRGNDMGENLAWNSSPTNAVGTLVQAWLQSPEHRANLLSDKYSRVGVGVDVGSFDGYSNALMVTTDFLGN